MSAVVNTKLTSEQRDKLNSVFGDQLQRSVSLAPYTAARVGGNADWFVVAESADQMVEAVSQLWTWEIPFFLLGGGSNILISDSGVSELVILNKARQLHYDLDCSPPTVFAESGTNLGIIARQCVRRGLSGLEWAAGIPGTVGGAVYGNAGAHGGDVSDSIQMAEILHRTNHGIVREIWHSEDFEFEYRSSVLKRNPGDVVILAVEFSLYKSEPEEIQTRMDEYMEYRRGTQPPGASMGSIFKNPSGDYAGRLIEAAGLKGKQIGGAQISPIHANFFINHEGAKASDIIDLIQLVQETVLAKFGVSLELEIELIGEW
jgi:UDP-N-acetylmuramate dehydrogenase